MRTDIAQPIRLKDYRPPDWLVETVSLDFSLHPTQTKVRATLALKPNPQAAAAPLVFDGDGLRFFRAQARRRRAAGGKLCGDARSADHCAGAEPAVHAGNRDAGRSDRQYPAFRSLSDERQLLHAMRGRRLPPHHLLSRPARCDGGLYNAHRSRQKRSAGAAVERQSGRGRRSCRRPSFRGLARPASQAVLSVRAGRRRPRMRRGRIPHHVRAQRHAAHLCRARQTRPLRLRHGFAQARHALGRGEIRTRIRSRYFHDRGGVRLQHGRHGEQGPQRLQRQIRAGERRQRDRRRLCRHRGGDRARIFPQLDGKSHHLPRLVPALPEGRAHRFPRPGIFLRHALARGEAHQRRARPARGAIHRGRRAFGASGPAGNL